jgi:hypothetical protein
MASWMLAVWIGLAAPIPTMDDGRAAARILEVGIGSLDVFAEPDDGSFATGRLHDGDKVEVRKALADGWLAIARPEGSFHWVDGDDVEPLSDGRLYVNAPKTIVRLGREYLPRPGPARVTVAEGTVFRPAKLPPLRYDDGRRRRTWRAVLAGSDEVRFVRSAGLVDPDQPRMPRARVETPERLASHAEAAPSDLPPEVSGPVRKIEGDHRKVLDRPIEKWDLGDVRRDYQTLLAARRDGPTKAAVRERLDRVDQEDELSRAARNFESLIEKSRRRDAEVESIKESLRALRTAETLAYDAEGLLQPTSRRVEGEKVFALISDEGQIVTYLRIPPGIDTTNLNARQVGVRGKSRFNEGLRFRLLDVRDIDALDSDR